MKSKSSETTDNPVDDLHRLHLKDDERLNDAVLLENINPAENVDKGTDEIFNTRNTSMRCAKVNAIKY